MNTMKNIINAGVILAGAVFSLGAADFVPESRTGAAIQKAIDAAYAAGGGRVALEKGATYQSGTLYLKSNVELNVPEGTTVLGNDTSDGYDDVDDPRIGRKPEKSAKVFIACLDAENVSITGKGVIDGQGVKFYDVNTILWKRFYAKPPHPRPRMIQFFNCRKIKFEDVTFKDSPGWTCWIRQCEDFTAERVKIIGDQKMINNDGFHMDSCRKVRIRNCDLKTGDDCIIMRAIRTPGGADAVCEDMIVENCNLDSACQCIRLTCPSDGIVRNGIFRNLKLRGFNGIASVHPARYLVEGEHGSALMENILIQDCDIESDGAAILFSVESGITLRKFGNVKFSDVKLKSNRPITLKGTGDTPLCNITFDDVTGYVKAENPIEMANVQGISFEDFKVTSGTGKKTKPAVNKGDSWERGLESSPAR